MKITSKKGNDKVEEVDIKSQSKRANEVIEFDYVEKWLSTVISAREDQKIEAYRKVVQNFADFSGKSVQDILAECNKLSGKHIRNNYCAGLLLSYTAYLQKSLPPNGVRQQINVIRSFCNYYKIPIRFGVRAHLQFFLK